MIYLIVGLYVSSYLPIKSVALVPKNSPRIVTLVPGGPSFGEIPVTTGGGPMLYVDRVVRLNIYCIGTTNIYLSKFKRVLFIIRQKYYENKSSNVKF